MQLTVDTSPYYHTEFELFPRIVQASQENRKLQIAYSDENDNVTVRQVTPLHLYRGKGYNMVLTAYCHKREAVRHFIVNRMLDVELGERLPETAEQAAVRFATEELAGYGIPTDDYTTSVVTLPDNAGYIRVDFYQKDTGRVILTRVNRDGTFVNAPALHKNIDW